MNKTALGQATLVLLALGVTASPAHASAVATYGPHETLSAIPMGPGTSVLDVRVAAGFPGYGPTFPHLSAATGLWEGTEFGVGVKPLGYLGGLGAGESSNLSVAPWFRMALPFGTDLFKTGLAVGCQVQAMSDLSAFTPGVAGLFDVVLGPLAISGNLGVSGGFGKRFWYSANAALSVPLGVMSLGEEQFINYAPGSVTHGGFRASVIYPLGDTLTVDASLAVLTFWDASSWILNPNLGMSWTF